MARLVAAFGTPHAPFLPEQVAKAPGQLPIEALMSDVRQQLENIEPDVIIISTSDHFTNFFFNHMPAFCVGVVDEAEGPAESDCHMPHYSVRIHRKMAEGLHRAGLKANFDLASAQEIKLDHTILVPLHFLTPDMRVPIIPIYNNGLAPPSPTARRCFALGRMVRRFVEDWPGNERVALLASGSISLEVGGPRDTSWFDRVWLDTVTGLMKEGRYQTLARRATSERMLAAGNVSQELLNWVMVTGAMNGAKPHYLQTDRGGALAAWSLEEER
jgi:protocatechuate 4,5-dioxygenase beta chain